MRTSTRVLVRRLLATSIAATVVAGAFAVGGPATAAVSAQSVADKVNSVANLLETESTFFDTTTPPATYPTYEDPATPESNDVTFTVDSSAQVVIGSLSQQPNGPYGRYFPVAVGNDVFGIYPPLPIPSGTLSTVGSPSGTTTGVMVGSSWHVALEKAQNRHRTLIQIDSASAPTTYTWRTDGYAKFSKDANGLYYIVRASDGQILGSVKPAWAKDANGNTVPTSYTVNASGDLVQTITHSGALYPVVADPSISMGWYAYVRYSKSETQSAWAQITIYGSSAYAALCIGIPNNWLKGACGATLGAYGAWIRDVLTTARNNNQCMEARWSYNGWLVGLRAYNC